MLRIKFTYFDLLNPNNPLNGDYYFASEALDYDNIYWEPRIIDPFDIERFFDVQSDTTNRIRTAQISLDNSDGFLNQFMTKTTTFLNNFMTLYYDNGNGVTKTFTGRVQSIDSVSSSVRLTLREFGYEYLENTFPDAQIAYDYYSDSGINDSWNCIPIHFGTVKRIPLSWVNSFYSEFIIGSGPILAVDKVYIDDEVAYDATQPNKRYKPTDDSKEIYIRIFRGRGWDADGKRETVVDTYRPETLDPTRETVSGNNVTHISQWGGFAYIQLFSIDDNGYEIPAYPYNTDGALGQVYVDIRGITRITKSGNNYTYTNTMVRNPAEIIKLMFCQPELVSEGPCAIGWGYKDSDVNFSQAITDCNNLGFVVDGSFDTSGQFVESLKVILQCCRGYIVEEGEKITLKIDKLKDVNTPSAEFDEEGITGFDCNLEEWNEPDLDSQTNRIRLNYDWSQEFKRYNKKPDVNHESPDYKDDNDYDEWLIDAEHNKKVQKWNTEELELKMISDTTTAHKLAIYYLRKKCLQHIQGTLSCANSAAMNLDAGDLIGVKSKQFNWYKDDSGGTDPNKGKVFQITSIKKGDELTDIDFVEYDPAVFIADSRTFNLKERPDKIANLIKPATPKSLTLTATSKEYAGTTICEINGTVVYASNSNKLFATVRYFDYGTSTPANDYTPPADANWITYGNVDSNKFTISGLTPGHWYFIQVYTVNANGSSEPIVNKVKSLGDIIPPGIPTVSHTFTSGRSVGVKIELLNPPTDFRGFMLYKDGTYLTSITTNIHQNKATCEYTDVCEKYKTTYHYKATSYDKWNNISQYSTEIDITTPEDIDLDDITGTIEILQDDIADTNTRIDEYVSDDVLSVGEKSRLAEDWLAIRDSRYNKVKTEAENHYFQAEFSVYHQDYLDFVNAYELLEAYVDGNGSPINLTPTPPAVLEESRIEGVGSTIKKKFSDYYDLEIKVLSDIDKDNKNRATTIYAECHTEANVASKWVILPDVVIFTGLRLCVKFFNGNTSPGVITLNIKRNVSDESGLITGGKLYHNSGFAIPVITFEAGTTITLVLTEKTETINDVDTTVQAWEFSDSSILGLGEQELSLGNKTFSLGMVNGNRIIAETVDTQQLNAQAVTSEKITSEQIIGKDFGTAENVGEIDDETHEHISGVRFNANGIKAYNANGETVSIGINGDITAISGFIGGWKINSTSISSTPTSSSMPSIVLNANGMIYSSNYVNGVEGWRIDSIGNAEFNSATIRGKIQSAIFQYDRISAVGGQIMVRRASIIVADSTHVNTSTNIFIKDPDEFEVGDCFYIKEDIDNMFYGIITAIDNDTESATYGRVTYYIPQDAGTFFDPENGQSVINYGNPMSGGLLLNGEGCYIDIFKNYTVPLERDYNIYDPILNINAWDSTTASIAEEDGVVDISGENNNGQAFGGVTVVKDKVGGRIFNFDGVDDYLKITNPPSSSLKNTDGITISINVKLEEVPSAIACIIAGTTGSSYMFGLQTSNIRQISLLARTSSSSETAKRIDSAQILPLHQLTNLTAVYNYSIGKMYLYVNGTLTDKADCFTTPLSIDLDALTIGGKIENTTLSQQLKGQISFVRVFNKPLTTEEVQVIYKQSLVTPYINSNMYEPILNLDADYSTTASIAVADGVIDVSGNHNNGQAGSGVSVFQDNQKGNVFDFASTNDGITIANKVPINANSGITYSFYINSSDFDVSSNYPQQIRHFDATSGNSNGGFVIRVLASQYGIIHYNGTTEAWRLERSKSFSLNTWYHFAFSIDPTNGTTMFIDGELAYTDSSKKIQYSGNTPLLINTNGSGRAGKFTDIRIYPRALTAEEVYNVYQQSLNPEAFENPEKLISYDEINVHHFSGDAIQLDHLVRLGNLNGIADITDDRYGIFLGDERSYLKYDSVDGLKLINSNFALDGSILSDNFLWIDGNGNLHDDINMEIASDVDKGITNGQRYTEEGSMLNMTSGAFVTPNVRFDNRGSFYTKSKAFFENPDNVSTFFDVKYTTIESKGNIVLYDYQDNYGDSTSPYEEGPGTIAMFTLGNRNSSTGLRQLSGIKLNGSLNSYQSFPSMMTLARTTSTTVDDNGNVSSYTTNKSSTVSHPFWLPVIQMSNLIYNNNTDKTDLYVDASVYPTALTGSNKTLNLGSGSYRWTNIYSKDANFNGQLNITATGTSYNEGIRIHPSSNSCAVITFCGTDNTGDSGTSANTWLLYTKNGVLGFYRNGSSTSATYYMQCDANGNWSMKGALTNSSGFIGDVTGNCSGSSGSCTGNSATATTATNSTNSKLTHTVGNSEYPLVFGSSFVITDAQQALRIGTPTATAANCALRAKAYCAAANTQGESYLVIGNNLAKASANNSRGGLYLYGTGTTWAYFRVGDQTANKTVTLVAPADVTLTLPSATGTLALTSSDITGNAATATTATSATSATTATNANNIKTTSTAGAWKDIIGVDTGFTSAANKAVHGHNSGSLSFYVDANATSGNQRAILRLGNATANTTAAGHNGEVWFYGTSTTYLAIKTNPQKSKAITIKTTGDTAREYTLPDAAGTIALTSSNITGSSASCSGNAATATKLKTAVKLKISDGTTSGTETSFDGSAGVTLNLPTTIVATINGDITGNSNSTTNVRITPTDSTTAYPITMLNGATASTNYALRTAVNNTTVANSGLKCIAGADVAANTEGTTTLVIGNGLAKASADNRTGNIRIHGNNTGYTTIKPGYNSTSNITITLPSSGGTLALANANTTGSASKWGGYAISVVSSLPASMDANTIYFLT